MKRLFLTSCDVNFAARVIALIESLWRWSPEAEITVLCLDEHVGPLLSKSLDRPISTVTISTLIEKEPRLAALRAERSAWEFYATLKPCVLGWALDRIPEGELLAFVDSDTFFFSSPEPVFDEMRTASIGLSPHRFNDTTAGLCKYGDFNAGFGLWRNDSIGKKCLSDWSEQCLEWCFCRVEGPRFMNQGYLSSWPERYENVVILKHPGENLGPWNAGSHRLESGPDGVLVDGHPLIFFHFSSIFRGHDGRWKIHDHWPALRQAFVLRNIFAPYLTIIDQSCERLADHFGKHTIGSVRYPDLSKPVLDLTDFPDMGDASDPNAGQPELQHSPPAGIDTTEL